MNRSELEAYITENYSTEGEHLFAKYPSFLVFRHNGNRKWFAVIMDIPRKNLGLPGTVQRYPEHCGACGHRYDPALPPCTGFRPSAGGEQVCCSVRRRACIKPSPVYRKGRGLIPSPLSGAYITVVKISGSIPYILKTFWGRIVVRKIPRTQLGFRMY